MSKKIVKEESKSTVEELKQKLDIVLAIRQEADRCVESLNKLKATLATISIF